MSIARSESNGSQLRRSDSAASHRNLLPEPGEARESGVALQGSSLTFYNRTIDNNPDWPGVKNYFASISAQPAYRKHSVEELRAIDYARAGSARAKYNRTHDLAANPPLAFLAISAMPAYADVCQEEIRLADYWYHPTESGIATFNELLSFGRAPAPREVSPDDPFPAAWSDPEKVKEDGFAVVPPEGVSGFEFIAPPMPPTLRPLVEPSSPNESSPKQHVVNDDIEEADEVDEETPEEPTSLLKQLQEMMRQAQQIKKGDDVSRMKHLRETAAMFNRSLGLNVPGQESVDDDVTETSRVESIERRFDDRARVDDESDEEERRRSFRESSQFPSALQLPDSPSSGDSGEPDTTYVPENIGLPKNMSDPFVKREDETKKSSPFPDDDLSNVQTAAGSNSETEPSTNLSSSVAQSESGSDTLELDEVSNAGSMRRPRSFIAPRSDAGVSDNSSDVVPASNVDELSELNKERLEDRKVEELNAFDVTPAVIPKVESNSGPFELSSAETRRVESKSPFKDDDMDVRGPEDEREEEKHANMKRMDSFLEDAAAVARVEANSEALVRTKSSKSKTSRSSSKKSAHSIPLDPPDLPVMPDVDIDYLPDMGSEKMEPVVVDKPEVEHVKSAEKNVLEVSAMTTEPLPDNKLGVAAQPETKAPEAKKLVPEASAERTERTVEPLVLKTKEHTVVPPITLPMDVPALPGMSIASKVTAEPVVKEEVVKSVAPQGMPPATIVQPTPVPVTDESLLATAVKEASVNKIVSDRPRAPARGKSRFNIGATEPKRRVVRSGSRSGIDRSSSTTNVRSSNALRKTSSISGISRASSRTKLSLSSNDQTEAGPKKKPKRSREEIETTQTSETNPFADSNAFSMSAFSNKPFVFGNDNLGQTKTQPVSASVLSDNRFAKLNEHPSEERSVSSTGEEATSKPTPSTSYDDFASRAAAAMLGSKSTSAFEHAEPSAATPMYASAIGSPFDNPTTSFDSSNANTSFDQRATATTTFDNRSNASSTVFDRNASSPGFDTEPRSKRTSFDSNANMFGQKTSEAKPASSFGTEKHVPMGAYRAEARGTVVAPIVHDVPPSFPKFGDAHPSSDLFKSLDLKPAPAAMTQSLPMASPRAKSFPASRFMNGSAPEFPPASQKRPVSMKMGKDQSNNMFMSAFQLFEKRTTQEMEMGMDVAPAELPPAPFAKSKSESKRESPELSTEKAEPMIKSESTKEKSALLKKKEAAREFALPAKKREPEFALRNVTSTDFSAVKRVLEERILSHDTSAMAESPQPMSASNSEDSIAKKNPETQRVNRSESPKVTESEPAPENASVFDIWRKKVVTGTTPIATRSFEKSDTRILSPARMSPQLRSAVDTKKEVEKDSTIADVPAAVMGPAKVMSQTKKKWAFFVDPSIPKEEPGSTASESPTSSGKSGSKEPLPTPTLAVPPPPLAPVLESEMALKQTLPEVDQEDADAPQSIKSILSNGKDDDDDKGPRHVSFRDLESVAIADHETPVDAGGLDTIQKPAPLPPYGNDTSGVEPSEGSDSGLSGSAEFQDCIDTIPSSKGKEGFWAKAFTTAKSRAEAAEDEIVSRENSMASLKLRKSINYEDPTDVENVEGPSISDSIARRMQMFQASAINAAESNEEEEKPRPRSVLLPKPPAVIPDPQLDDIATRRNNGVLKNISDRFFGPKKSDPESPQPSSRGARPNAKQSEKKATAPSKSSSRKTIPKPMATSSKTSVRDVLSSKPSAPKAPNKSFTRPKPPSTSPPPPPPPPPTFLRAGSMGEKKVKPPKPPKASTLTSKSTLAEDTKPNTYQEKLDGTKKTSSAVRKSSSAHSATAVKSKSRTRNTTGSSARQRARKSEEVRKVSEPIEKISIPTPMGEVEFDSPKAKSFGHLDNVSLPKRSKSKGRNARERDVKVGSNSTRRREQKQVGERGKGEGSSVPSRSKSSKGKSGTARHSFRGSKDTSGAGASSTAKRKTTGKKQLRDGQNDVKRSAKHQGPKSGRRKIKGVTVAASRSVSDLGKKSKRMDSNAEALDAARAHSDIFSVPPALSSTSKDEYDVDRDASSLAIMQTPGATRQMSLTRRHSLPSRASNDGGGHSSLLPSANRNRKGQPRTHTMLAALWGQGMGRDDNSFGNLKSRRASTDLDEERVKRLRENGENGGGEYSGDRGGLIANVRRLFSRRVRKKERERASVSHDVERPSIAGVPEQREARGSITRGSLGGIRGSTQRGSTGMRGSINSVRTSTAGGRREARRAKSEHKNGKRRGALFKSQ